MLRLSFLDHAAQISFDGDIASKTGAADPACNLPNTLCVAIGDDDMLSALALEAFRQCLPDPLSRTCDHHDLAFDLHPGALFAAGRGVHVSQ
jgi:hypothetical protein